MSNKEKFSTCMLISYTVIPNSWRSIDFSQKHPSLWLHLVIKPTTEEQRLVKCPVRKINNKRRIEYGDFAVQLRCLELSWLEKLVETFIGMFWNKTLQIIFWGIWKRNNMDHVKWVMFTDLKVRNALLWLQVWLWWMQGSLWNRIHRESKAQ